MRAFVTGGTGFIGRHLVSRLRARGDDVVALVRSPARAEALGDLGCELVTGDLDDAAVMQEAMEGCDAAFHGAAVYKIGVTEDECRDMHRTNVDGTATVFEASAAAGGSSTSRRSTASATPPDACSTRRTRVRRIAFFLATTPRSFAPTRSPLNTSPGERRS